MLRSKSASLAASGDRAYAIKYQWRTDCHTGNYVPNKVTTRQFPYTLVGGYIAPRYAAHYVSSYHILDDESKNLVGT